LLAPWCRCSVAHDEKVLSPSNDKPKKCFESNKTDYCLWFKLRRCWQRVQCSAVLTHAHEHLPHSMSDVCVMDACALRASRLSPPRFIMLATCLTVCQKRLG
jgi:hypothetical protein